MHEIEAAGEIGMRTQGFDEARQFARAPRFEPRDIVAHQAAQPRILDMFEPEIIE